MVRCHCTHPSLLLPRLPLPFHATQVVSLTSTLLYRGGRTSITGVLPSPPSAIVVITILSFPDLFTGSHNRTPKVSLCLPLCLFHFCNILFCLYMFFNGFPFFSHHSRLLYVFVLFMSLSPCISSKIFPHTLFLVKFSVLLAVFPQL